MELDVAPVEMYCMLDHWHQSTSFPGQSGEIWIWHHNISFSLIGNHSGYLINQFKVIDEIEIEIAKKLG